MLREHQRFCSAKLARKFLGAAALLLWLALSVANRPAFAANFTSGPAHALKFGTHEIVLTGNGEVANPFDRAVDP